MSKVIELTLTEEQKAQINSQTMTLEQFLEFVKADESSLNDLCGDDAVKAV